MESLVQPGRQVEPVGELAGDLRVPDSRIIATGHADIYRGVWTSPEGTLIEVAVKELRTLTPRNRQSDPEALKRRVDIRMKREVLAWSHTPHKNLHPLLGYRSEPRPRFISPWCRHGNFTDYLLKNPDLNRLDKLRIVYQVGCALNHLHSQAPPICHADIKPENVFINDYYEAWLSGFGLSRVLTEFGEPDGLTTSESAKGTLNYMARELFIGEQARPSLETDVYSFGCLILTVMSGYPPYFKLRGARILLEVIEGRPPRLEDHPGLPPSDPLWLIIRKCWSLIPSTRPTMQEVLGELNQYTEVIRSSSATSPDDDIGHLVTITSSEAVCVNGRFGDIFEGIHKTIGRVALKRPRIGGTDDEKDIIRRFEKEGATWRRLDHPHILKFLGTFRSGKHIYFVSPFIKNGALLGYVKEHPEVNRVKLLCETADAIHYLHQNKVVHGDIKASNILVSDENRVLLCDFGLAKYLYSETSIVMKRAGTLRWQSPELWDDAPKTFKSDVYAFSMTIVEVVTGFPPFSHITNEGAILMAVYIRQERPKKTPAEFNGVSYENAWAVAEACWSHESGDRIPISEALRRLREDPSLV